MQSRLRVRVFLCFILCFVVISSIPYVAQGSEVSPDLENKYQEAFDAMMADLNNPERNFEFALVAEEKGDLRRAIAALERILLIKPGLTNIQLFLGTLYLRVNSPDLAEAYLGTTLEAPTVPEGERARAEALQSRAQTSLSQHRLSGTLFVGGVFDSNATAAPNSREIRIRGQNGLLDEADTSDDDFSLITLGDLRHSFNLGTYAGHVIESNLLLFLRRYNENKQINVTSIDLEVGPRFFIGPVLIPNLSIRPFLSGSYLFLDDTKYLYTLGSGVNLRKSLTSRVFLDVTAEADYQDFKNSRNQPTSSNRSGPYASIRSLLNFQVRATTQLSARIAGERRFADKEFETFNRGGFGVGVTEVYPAPFDLTPVSWSSSLTFNVLRRVYDEADPLIDPSKKRKETRIDLSFTTNIRLNNAWTIVLNGQYTNNNASLPNFDYENKAVSVGLSWRFL